jgi:uncharacterized protein (UPF0276 family)
MPVFTVSYSTALLELVRRDGLRCDGVEVGPYFSPGQVRRAASELPGWRIELHASTLGLRPFTRRPLEAYLKVTHSRWISCHVRLLSALELRLALRLRVFLPMTHPTQRMQGMIDAVRRLKKWAPLPVILENMPCSHSRHRLECDPQVTSEILAASGCDLLLDLAHARVGAQHYGLSPVEYLSQLPLEKVRQIHVSGPRMRGEYLYDAHEAMGEEDYALLDWALGHCDPEVVTLEYFREREALGEQVERVKMLMCR